MVKTWQDRCEDIPNVLIVSESTIKSFMMDEIEELREVNVELMKALRDLIRYANGLETKYTDSDGDHPAMANARKAFAKAKS